MSVRATPTEGDEQRVVVGWCRAHGVALFGVPNGMHLAQRGRYGAIARAKAEGMWPGAPDLVLVDRAPRTGAPVAIEMKRSVGGRVSNEQALVHARMRSAGWVVVVARGADAAIDALRELGYGMLRSKGATNAQVGEHVEEHRGT